ncbi:hypothetical protein BDE02_08G200900 [Populus trichocarpa]|nr:hypothetical protein BDE02_08G200900 [Populus trichocarpa]
MLEIQRIEMTSHQSTVQHLLHCIMSNGFKSRVLTHIRIQLQKKKSFVYMEQQSNFNNSSCGREIRLILRSNFKGPWHNWEKVD